MLSAENFIHIQSEFVPLIALLGIENSDVKEGEDQVLLMGRITFAVELILCFYCFRVIPCMYNK